jgi:hypothetical protein
MPLHQIHDKRRKWREIADLDIIYVFVYREGTLDQATYDLYHFDENGDGDNSTSIGIRNKGNNTPPTIVVSLKDISVHYDCYRG